MSIEIKALKVELDPLGSILPCNLESSFNLDFGLIKF